MDSSLDTPAATAENPQPPFFAVSVPKLAVMSVASFGVYELYWTYRNWSLERARTREPLSPLWRTVFAPIWIYSLLTRISRSALATGVAPTWRPGLTAAVLIIAALCSSLPDPYWLVSFLTFVPLLPVQRTVNQLNVTVAPAAPKNDSYSGGNLLLVVLGFTLLFLAIWEGPPGGWRATLGIS